MRTIEQFRKSKKPCPRCGRVGVMFVSKVLNKLSRKNNQTYICQQCGTDEALLPKERGLDAPWKDALALYRKGPRP